jgi:hypothetical protein
VFASIIIVFAVCPMHGTAAEKNGVYLGPKIGTEFIENSGNPIGLALGYDFKRFGLEFEHVQGDRTVDGLFGGFNPFGFSEPSRNVSQDFSITSLYGTYRTGGKFYFKARAGVANQNFNPDGEEEDGVRLAGGLGMGMYFERCRIELEFTAAEGDGLNYVGLGLLFNIKSKAD